MGFSSVQACVVPKYEPAGTSVLPTFNIQHNPPGLSAIFSSALVTNAYPFISHPVLTEPQDYLQNKTTDSLPSTPAYPHSPADPGPYDPPFGRLGSPTLHTSPLSPDCPQIPKHTQLVLSAVPRLANSRTNPLALLSSKIMPWEQEASLLPGISVFALWWMANLIPKGLFNLLLPSNSTSSIPISYLKRSSLYLTSLYLKISVLSPCPLSMSAGV